MTYVYISRQGDIQEIQKYLQKFKSFSDSELKEACEDQKKCGIVGVHQQALYLIALRKEMHLRFGESPIMVEDNSLIGFKETDDDIED